MARQVVAIYERRATWARQLRPRLAGRPSLRWVEARSGADLESALAGAARPVGVFDLGDRVRAGLEDLDRAARVAPDLLALVLDPRSRPGVAPLARELGATFVWEGPAPPPLVAGLLGRWLELAARRAAADGYLGPAEPEPEPWDLAV